MNADFFKMNRQKLAEAVKGAPIILVANAEMQRVGDEAFSFAQEANFWYLTGIEAADWQVVIADGQTTLITPDVSKISQIFNGSLSADRTQKISGADAVITRDEASDFLKNIAKKHTEVYTVFPSNQTDFDFFLNPAPLLLRKKLEQVFNKVKDVRSDLAKLRAIKTKEEIMMLRRAINLTRLAFEIVKGELPNYTFEYEAQARFTYEFERAGAMHAYDPIVAGGKNAVTLHYNANNSGINRGELLLMDVGARYGGYSADITRTYATGDIIDRQKAVHDAVRQAQTEIINLIRPGLAVKDYQEKSDYIMKRILQERCLYKKEDDFRKYFPHAVSHGLGIETHDPLGRLKAFLPGMVLTVEPGIYIPEENIGVRLEDDILVTETGNENLSRCLSSDF